MISSQFRQDRLFLAAGLILLIACSCASASANSAWSTRFWKTDDGLPDNNVEAIAQGPDDYLWVVTSAGLARFDGVRFNLFPIEDFGAPVDSHIHTVLCGRSGVVWMVSDDGKVIGLNPDFSTISSSQAELPTHVPQTLAEDADGALWLGYFGSPWTGYSSEVYRIKNGHVTQFGAKDGVPWGNFHSLTSDEAGNIWLAKGREICVFWNGRFQHVAKAPVIQCLAPTHTNAVWFVSGGHLFTCDIEGALRDYGAYQPSDANTWALLEDHTGAVWIGTDGNGLFRYSKSGFEKIETSHSIILSLAEDREGNIWAGTGGGGLDRVSLNGVRMEALENNQPPNQIQCICQDNDGVLWGVTQNGALVCRINDNWKSVLTNAPPFAGTVRCVAAGRDGTVWVGLRDGQLARLANTNYTMLHLTNNRVHSSIFALLPASSGNLWVLRRDSLQYLQDEQLENVKLPRQVQRISAIAEDAAGNIWVGARGVVLRSNEKDFVDETPHLPISRHAISCLYGTPDGSMWISCEGLGLLRFKQGQVSQIGVGQGLPDDDISEIVADGHGCLWFGSNHGIFKIQQRELERAMADPGIHLHPIVYGKNEGLISVEALSSIAAPYVLPQAISINDGCVWLLTHTGVVRANLAILSEKENSEPPQVLLTRVAMDGQNLASYGESASTQIGTPLKMRLPPSYRRLEFDFTAFHFSAPENVRFRYQLAGFDTNWIDAGTERSANYSRLTAGNYQFHAEACIGDGSWSVTPATFAFTVAPFFWQTWWFRIGALLLFTVSVIAIVRYISFRRLQMEMRLIEQRAALDKERTRIARDLHDDLGSSLNSVALTLDMVQRLAPPESVNGKIQHCSVMVRQVARSVDEIVWAINPRNDTLRYAIDYISQFTVEFLHSADISCRVDLPDKVPDQMVSPEARHNLLLIIKEALSNIARHAHASEVRLHITASENQITIAIEDNGRGFECTPDNASCDGLRNMRQRMEEIGGQFQLDSRPGKGTRIAVFYSWPLANGQ